MTRDEIEKISAVEPYCFETDREERWYEIGCIDGLKAADAEPNLESLWHDANEEPQGDEWHIAYIDVFGSMHSLRCPSVTFDTFPSLAKFAAGVGMQCWAYISDLLPKGGEK